jgi:hypothetical protein
VREGLADSLKQRLDIHSAAYGKCSCGHAWLTLDGNVIANFCTRAASNARGYEPASDRINSMYTTQFADYGELSRQDAYASCWAFVHDLNIEQALCDQDPLIQSLAVVDKRLGKRRLEKLDPPTFHRLAAMLLDIRLQAEGMPRDSVLPFGTTTVAR